PPPPSNHQEEAPEPARSPLGAGAAPLGWVGRLLRGVRAKGGTSSDSLMETRLSRGCRRLTGGTPAHPLITSRSRLGVYPGCTQVADGLPVGCWGCCLW